MTPKQPSPSEYVPEMYPPIAPIPSKEGWEVVPIVDTEISHEPLVPVGIFSDYRKIFTSSVYADEHHNSPYSGGLEGSNIAVFMREGVAKRLEKAAELLPKGHHLMVMDAYRTLTVQGALYEQYRQPLMVQHPDWTEQQIVTETKKYVSVPSTDKTRPSPHNTGASVDVVLIKLDDAVQAQIDDIDAVLDQISEQAKKEEGEKAYLLEMKRSQLIRRNAQMLNFGTPFDYGGPEAALRHFEVKAANGSLAPKDEEALRNRRLLYSVMTSAGMEPYEDEWWHYNDPASQLGAKVAGREYAEYGAIELSAQNADFTKMRMEHHVNSVRMARGEAWHPPKGLEIRYKIAQAAITGDNPANAWRMTDMVAKIAPPKAAETVKSEL